VSRLNQKNGKSVVNPAFPNDKERGPTEWPLRILMLLENNYPYEAIRKKKQMVYLFVCQLPPPPPKTHPPECYPQYTLSTRPKPRKKTA